RVTDRGVQFFFIDNPELFDRPQLYEEGGADYPDNHIRFAVFCRAVLGVVRSLFRPDIIHCHDWQSALVAPYMRHEFRADPTFTGIPNLMTIHNLGYQGVFGREVVDEIGFGREMYQPARMEFWGRANFLKAGVVFADAVSTVSEGYAREIQTPEYGFGLDGLLRTKAGVIKGILNGVDYDDWNPETDRFTAAPYSEADLSGKQICKQDVLRTFGLADDDLSRPLIGIVSRFVSQKGFDLIEEISDWLMSQDIMLVAIGSGEPQYEASMRSLADRYPDKASVIVAYDNEIAHKVEAGADIFLMPSRYEPCGLNQIYSLRYGTVPVVRATGGLDDTIDESTGFKFDGYSGPALMNAITLALEGFRDRTGWEAIMKTGMKRDHSWGAAAAQYSSLYRRMAAE
ncbi:MAG: glycogen synthase, partial [Bryobacteraceae bacterium]|nr:glycogen synthase [Bryobacteraceae bacterium]